MVEDIDIVGKVAIRSFSIEVFSIKNVGVSLFSVLFVCFFFLVEEGRRGVLEFYLGFFSFVS
jgi:hypothetical protein